MKPVETEMKNSVPLDNGWRKVLDDYIERLIQYHALPADLIKPA